VLRRKQALQTAGSNPEAQSSRAWCAERAVLPDEPLTEQILDGFGPSSSGEDPFDAVVGLFGMIDTLHRGAEPDLPDDPAIRSVEGWMSGQYAMSVASDPRRPWRAVPPPFHRFRHLDDQGDSLAAATTNVFTQDPHHRLEVPLCPAEVGHTQPGGVCYADRQLRNRCRGLSAVLFSAGVRRCRAGAESLRRVSYGVQLSPAAVT
jgi:hypothetical protein